MRCEASEDEMNIIIYFDLDLELREDNTSCT